MYLLLYYLFFNDHRATRIIIFYFSFLFWHFLLCWLLTRLFDLFLREMNNLNNLFCFLLYFFLRFFCFLWLNILSYIRLLKYILFLFFIIRFLFRLRLLIIILFNFVFLSWRLLNRFLCFLNILFKSIFLGLF